MATFADDGDTPAAVADYFAGATEPLTFANEFKSGPLVHTVGWQPVPPHRTAVTMRNVRRAITFGSATISVRCGTREADFALADLMVNAIRAGDSRRSYGA